jgi:hypothetical protein
VIQPTEPDKTCPECGSRHAIHTGHLRGTSKPTFEGAEAKPYDEQTETELRLPGNLPSVRTGTSVRPDARSNVSTRRSAPQ